MPTFNQVRFRFPPLTQSLLRTVMLWLIFSAILYLLSRYNYLLFHSLAELFSISVAAAIFMLVWNTRQFTSNDFLFFIGVSYFFAGIIDLLHTLAYKGMGVFPANNANLPTQLWIAARYLQSVSLLAAVLWIRQKLNHRLLLFIIAAVTVLLLASIATGLFPDCYVNGLTPFKKVSEYIISFLLAVAALRLRRERELFHPTILFLITLSIIFTILSELTFTFYTDVYGPFNFLGHIFRIFAIYCLYKSVIETGLNQPFDLLFHGMKKREMQLENSQKLLHEMATRDPLTGLPNRFLFEARLMHALEKSQRMNHAALKSMVQVIIMDMDDFKNVNDMFGHLFGDEVLRQMGQRLKAEIRESDTVARWGGDEFTCILEDVATIKDAEHTAQKIMAALSSPILVQGQELKLTVSLGFSLFPLHGQAQEDLLRKADAALYSAKETKNKARMYDESMHPFNGSMFSKTIGK